jgi:dephospho-CoA kinase
LYGFPYAIKEAALIFESESHLQLDHVIGVSSPLPLRIERVKERDGLAEDQILERIRSQMDEEEKMKRCDWVLINDEQQLLIPQVVELHEKLKLPK